MVLRATAQSSDISSTSGTAIPDLSANLAAPVQTPVDLATLAWDASAPGAFPQNSAAPGWLAVNAGTTVFPLPVSGATGGGVNYSAADGYWVKQYYPTITGCLKIDYQSNGGAWTDITPTILQLGYTGRNINPQLPGTFSGANAGQASPDLLPLPGAQVSTSGPTIKLGVATVGCNPDPSPNAVIRFARVRDNPSFANVTGGGCGNPAGQPQHGTDYWPNVLYDTREGMLRDTNAGMNPPAQVPVAGAMYYVELDIQNLAQCFTNAAICPGLPGNRRHYHRLRGLFLRPPGRTTRSEPTRVSRRRKCAHRRVSATMTS